jgi:hypothetical protein
MERSFFRLLMDFSELDRQITKLRELRDSYRKANISYYGKELAALLDD